MSQSDWRETLARVRKASKSPAVVSALNGMTHSYNFSPDHIAPAVPDRNLTAQDMNQKAKILEELLSDLLPSINVQLNSLLSSLDLIDLDKNPDPDYVSTMEILSVLDQTLQSVVSSIVFLTLNSPLPDEKHDHGLKNLKIYRCSHLRNKVEALIVDIISNRLFPTCASFVEFSALSTVCTQHHGVWNEVSRTREEIHMIVTDAQRTIKKTINWARKAINPASQSIPEDDPTTTKNLNNENAAIELLAQLAKSTIPLLKLGRILVKRTLEWISKNLVFRIDAEVSSEALEQLRKVYKLIIVPLEDLGQLLGILQLRNRAINVENQPNIQRSVLNLTEAMNSCLVILDSYLLPFLDEDKDDSDKPHFESLFPTLRNLWDKASANLMGVALSFEFERIAIGV
ncbi:hypothetical protein PGTUg99_003717 [Puccinia graminis f. sp. tritici]|uniref:Uncharacterized protein n=1 Tax=Puccinia graminis f. sp. tritici TaxID=56615 RepID=A0A5B0RWZ8_PUCGR|nr:hypothetical protein PGTUg99_003717 [Puccinia graminis f. sp. tritici]